MKLDQSLVKRLRAELKAVSDPESAAQMQAYMKSAMPYHGVKSPVSKKIFKSVFENMRFVDREDWTKAVLSIWRSAEFREERYGALFLAAHKSAKAFQVPHAMNLYEELVVTGAWWDYVDDIATHRVGDILAKYPKQIQGKMLRWSKSPNIWKRRTAILCQIGQRESTDLDFLYQCIEPSIQSDEFFLRKAIGWSLRQVAWRNPTEIVRYVRANRDRLSPLSKREALKNVLKTGKIKTIP